MTIMKKNIHINPNFKRNTEDSGESNASEANFQSIHVNPTFVRNSYWHPQSTYSIATTSRNTHSLINGTNQENVLFQSSIGENYEYNRDLLKAKHDSIETHSLNASKRIASRTVDRPSKYSYPHYSLLKKDNKSLFKTVHNFRTSSSATSTSWSKNTYFPSITKSPRNSHYTWKKHSTGVASSKLTPVNKVDLKKISRPIKNEEIKPDSSEILLASSTCSDLSQSNITEDIESKILKKETYVFGNEKPVSSNSNRFIILKTKSKLVRKANIHISSAKKKMQIKNKCVEDTVRINNRPKIAVKSKFTKSNISNNFKDRVFESKYKLLNKKSPNKNVAAKELKTPLMNSSKYKIDKRKRRRSLRRSKSLCFITSNRDIVQRFKIKRKGRPLPNKLSPKPTIVSRYKVSRVNAELRPSEHTPVSKFITTTRASVSGRR